MAYSVPGRADDLSPALVQKWNEEIRATWDGMAALQSRFMTLDPATVEQPVHAAIKWFGDPAEPQFCIDEESARALSDWPVRGRQALHNEYCEYVVIHRRDATGKLRPKRVQVTTELREYWSTIAVADPDTVRAMATSTLGAEPSWKDLYGIPDPFAVDESAREIAFGHAVAGHGSHEHLVKAGVPAQPTGPLNIESALFMTHPINGLDDLIYIVLFGAHPYSVREGERRRPATREEIFISEGVQQLACRHADPAAAAGAHGAAMEGRTVAFADPLGMYLQSLAQDLFLIRGEVVPDAWVRWSRGQKDLHQRLEFGPGDEDAEFLDDIVVAEGASEEPLTGGYQLLKQVEIGPRVIAGPSSAVGDDEYRDLDVPDPKIECREADVCREMATLKAEYDRIHGQARLAPRVVGRVA